MQIICVFFTSGSFLRDIDFSSSCQEPGSDSLNLSVNSLYYIRDRQVTFHTTGLIIIFLFWQCVKAHSHENIMRHCTKCEPGSSVSTVSGYGLDDRAIEVRSPAEAKDFSSSLCVHTGSGFHPASCTMGTGGPFTGAKASALPQAPPWRVVGRV
jgi:hypothetical protein